MRRIGLFAATFAFVAVLSAVSFAQPGAAAPAPAKIAIINSQMFAAETGGITKYVNAVKQINTEFAPRKKEIDDMEARLRKIEADLTAMTKPGVPVNEAAARAKQDEGTKLQVEYKRKGEDLQNDVNRRGAEILDPIQGDIFKAIQEYSTSKGYAIVFDLTKMGGDGSILAIDPKFDITKEFIAYYNTRPAGAATAVKP